jgi:sugar (pentulose or hexulose) kinase
MTRKAILVLDLGSTSGRAFVFGLPEFEIIGSSRFEVSRVKRIVDNNNEYNTTKNQNQSVLMLKVLNS